MIQSLKKECKRRLEEESLHRIISCLSKLSEEQIWFSPNKNTNSVGNLVLHLAGNIRQYIWTAIGNYPDIRNRDQEFIPNQNIASQDLANMISEVICRAVVIISKLDEDDLPRVVKVQCFEEEVLSILIHVIEHTSYHTGQISWITKSLINEDLKYYGDLPLTETN